MSLLLEGEHSHTDTPLHRLTPLSPGDSGSGKTALAAKLAKESAFPFVKVITPEDLVGFSESMITAKLNSVRR